MSVGAAIVIALRLIVPLSIFRRPLAGGVIAMLLDGADVILIDAIGLGGFGGQYHRTDKVLDLYYLSIEATVAIGWMNAYARLTALGLFGYRIIGVALFELTEQRIFLFAFPNLFENWWLYVVAADRFWPRLRPASWRGVSVALAALLIPKMGQEYLLHYTEAQPWNWFKRQTGIF